MSTPSPTLRWLTRPTCPAKTQLLPTRGAAGDADLGAKDRVGADLDRVADLDEVVDFRPAADARFADRGAVDAGARLNFHVGLR